MNKLSLCGDDWKLIYVKNETFMKDGETDDIGLLLSRGYSEIPATVPGNLEIDLMKADKIEDPFYGKNSLNRECEYFHLFYYKKFYFDGKMRNPLLVFEGLDTIADVLLNGIKIGHSENMLVERYFEPESVLEKGNNTLLVHIYPAVLEARKYRISLNEGALKYNYESLFIRKAPHMYGWDIMPRLVSGGIWRPVYLQERKPDRITDFYGYTVGIDPDRKKARLAFTYNTELSSDDISVYSIEITGHCGSSCFRYKSRLWHSGGCVALDVDDAELWWPANSGNANIYDVSATLIKNGKNTDRFDTTLGIRTVELERTSTTNSDGTGQFLIRINGKPVFCMGTNWVPADALHSRDKERLPLLLPMLSDLSCNIIRIWGGNVYEDDMLYDYCDRNGIMVWQDFMMGCAVYPQDDEFADKIADEVTFAVKRLRRHPSIILWAGDNECDIAYLGWFGKRRNPNKNILTRSVIPSVLSAHDFSRPYLPSSPYVDEDAFRSGSKNLSEDHLWGPRDYFKGDFYRNSVCHFASETGYHGCPSPASLNEYIPPQSLWTARNSINWEGIDNEIWLAHAASEETVASAPYGYRIRLMADQVSRLFGHSVPCTLEDFSKASQISQAEALKYFIERFRISKWRRTGIIWWNLADGWHQISDSVVDYSLRKKLAYHYIKRSQNPLCLMFDEPQNEVISLYAVNDLNDDKTFDYKITDLTSGLVKASGKGSAASGTSSKIFKMNIEADEKHFYFIEWNCNGSRGVNHYMTNIERINYREYLKYLEKTGLDQFEGFN